MIAYYIYTIISLKFHGLSTRLSWHVTNWATASSKMAFHLIFNWSHILHVYRYQHSTQKKLKMAISLFKPQRHPCNMCSSYKKTTEWLYWLGTIRSIRYITLLLYYVGCGANTRTRSSTQEKPFESKNFNQHLL